MEVLAHKLTVDYRLSVMLFTCILVEVPVLFTLCSLEATHFTGSTSAIVAPELR